MRPSGLSLLLLPVLLGGCLADARIARMHVDLAGELRDGNLAEAKAIERRILETADNAFGPGSVEAVRARVDLAESCANWERFDLALAVASATVASLDPNAPNQAVVGALVGLSEVQIAAHLWRESEATTDRLLELCRNFPPHVATYDDPYDECHFARFDIDDLYLAAGAYRKSVSEFLRWSEERDDPADRRAGILELTVAGRSYALYGAYPEAAFYFQRCVDETRAQYAAGGAPPAMRKEATPTAGVEVFTVDSAHSFESQEPRCIEDLIEVRRALGEEDAARELERWREDLWASGPDLEKNLVEEVRQADSKWKDDYNTSADANALAFYYAGKGRTADAIRTYEEAIALIDRRFAKDGVFAGGYPGWLMTDELLGLAREYEKASQPASAVPVYARALEIAERRFHPAHRRRLEALAGNARTLLAAGRVADSISAWNRYLSIAADIRGADHADYATGLEGMARALEAAGRSAEARTMRARASSIRRDYARKVAAVRDLPLPVSLRPGAPPAN